MHVSGLFPHDGDGVVGGLLLGPGIGKGDDDATPAEQFSFDGTDERMAQESTPSPLAMLRGAVMPPLATR